MFSVRRTTRFYRVAATAVLVFLVVSGCSENRSESSVGVKSSNRMTTVASSSLPISSAVSTVTEQPLESNLSTFSSMINIQDDLISEDKVEAEESIIPPSTTITLQYSSTPQPSTSSKSTAPPSTTIALPRTADGQQLLETSESLEKIDTALFSGRIYLSRDGVPESVELNPVHSRLRVPRSVSASGDYSLEFRGASGDVLRSVPFSAEEGILDINPEQDIDIDAFPRIAFFSVLVSSLPDFASVAVVHSDSDLAVFESSSSTPSVTVSGVAAGQVFTAIDTLNLSWSGIDTDGEDLDYLVYYSVDGGATYRLIYLARDDTSKDFDAVNLKGSSRARFGVSVSDGIKSVFAETPVFAVDGKAPVARITSPGAGSVFAGKQGFLLDGWAHDTEDGFLGSSSFNWSSSLDGNLGTGSYLVLSADELTAGNHQITLTVTDSDNMTSTAAIPITVNRQNQLPVANDDNIRVALDETALFDVLANDIDVEGDFRHDTLRILIPPSLGIAQILIGSQGKPVLSYTAGPTGKDALIYLICDGINRCATATVTIYIHADDCTIMGTEGDDHLRGTSERDVICALGGDDEIDGRGGDDIIRAGSGNDTIYAQTGNDIIYGGRGHDAILGHRGNDIIYGGLGDDEIWGGGGDDTIWGGFGADEIRGEADNDTLYGEDGPDLIHGGRGNDTIYGGTGNDTIRGNEGDDTIYGDLGDDEIWGGGGDDEIWGEPGADNIRGEVGNDYIIGGDGPDLIHGDLGNDTLWGERGDDTIYGNQDEDRIFPGVGDDTVVDISPKDQ